ncbi:MAG TPA: permease-like cell division protein FtsX [Acidimicrobiales bacterium]|nr:permease-like cell division protein FtsX [Acidimicrobiales bacterium]
MAISANYVARETFANLRRNVGMTIAAILTVAVSLALVGGALLLRQGVNKATLQYRGGVELSIFMRADAPDGQIEAVRRELASMPEAKKFTFVNKEEAFKEYQKIFADSEDVREIVTPADLPTSFRVVPAKAELVDVIGRRFATRPGVLEVVYAKDAIDKLLDTTRTRQVAYFGVAAVLLVGAVLLIINAIQLAVFSRRREIGVMKLVGATNWFIRLPFMLEGTVQGLAGSLVAAVAVYVARNPILGVISDPSLNAGLTKATATSSDAFGTGIFLVLLGAAIGAIGSAFAVRRFLRV